MRIAHFGLTGLVGAMLVAPSSGAAQLAPPNDAGITWGHIHLNVSDVEAHKRLWTEHFGGTVVQKGSLVTVRLPGTIMALREQEPTGGSRGSGVDHFGFSVPDLQAFLARWRADGLNVEAEFEGYDGRPQAYVSVPDGIRVELQEVPTLAVPAAPYHVHIYTAGDPEALRDWYADLFSMTPRVRGSIQFTADVPGMNLSVNPAEEAPAPTRGRAVDHIGFEVDDLEAFCAALEARGIEFSLAYREIDSIELGIAFFTDPSGVLIELTEGFDKY
ncbi:MAG: VOC family protein [Gemmatimonadota bacterium]|nr:VOC family protein [Gemmatimonadota bacterium]